VSDLQYYAHKKYLVRFEEMHEDGILYTQFTSIPFLKGDKIATDYYGNKWVVPKGQEEEYYAPVEVKQNIPSKKPSPFEEQYTKQLIETPVLNQEEDTDYIKNTRNMISKL
jgi:hypothetical protein